MTRIFIRNRESSDWKPVESAEYREETELQQLLAKSPSLIPIDEIRDDASPLIVAIPEFGLPGSGATDLLAFSADGDMAVIECKLATNSEIKRKVIGQILEYGAYLWEVPYEELDQRIINKNGKGLVDLIRTKLEGLEGADDLDEEAFRNSVEESLASGSFMLIIAVDQTNPELRKTIGFLNGCGKPVFSFHALEMRRSRVNEAEILELQLYGPPLPPKPSPIIWTEEKFLQVANEKLQVDVMLVIEDLYQMSKNSADKVAFGKGRQTGSFTFQYLISGKLVSVFSVYTSGGLMLNYNGLKNRVKIEVLEEFHQSIHAVPSLSSIPADFSKWPSVKVADAFMNQAGAIDQFKESVRELGIRLHSPKAIEKGS